MREEEREREGKTALEVSYHLTKVVDEAVEKEEDERRKIGLRLATKVATTSLGCGSVDTRWPEVEREAYG